MISKLFPTNEGRLDRALHVVAGLALLMLAVRVPHFVWAYIGVVPLRTGIVGSCPAYTLFGITTCPYRPARKTT